MKQFRLNKYSPKYKEELIFKKIISATAVCLSLFSQSYADFLTDEQKINLVQFAVEAQQNAYAPYSNFHVGAALITFEGLIYQGCTVENASYGLACCAERTAVFNAVSDGSQDIAAIAVVVPGGGTPCGACRQVLNEFNPNMLILLGNENGEVVEETTLMQLLPNAFGPYNLGK